MACWRKWQIAVIALERSKHGNRLWTRGLNDTPRPATRLRSGQLSGPAVFHLPFRPLRGWSVCLGQRVALLLSALPPGTAGVEIWRWPLWDPGQNGGEPLLGNPIAAVFYPGKVLYALSSYAWGARLYVIAHTIIAFVGLIALCRSFGVTWVGSFLGGLSYAFGAPVLFLNCNVVFLVGASWLPWGLCAVDRLLRQRRRSAGAEVAVILALQVLGGDPEAAYLTALCGAGYALLLTARVPGRLRLVMSWQWALAVVCLWIAATLGLAAARLPLPATPVKNWQVAAAWGVVAAVIGWRWYHRPEGARLGPLLASLGGACGLAAALSAAQVLPALEFAGQSWRAAGLSSTTLFQYSMSPGRLAEFFWPNVFGASHLQNRSWLQALSPVGEHEIWVDSLYLGGLTIALALSACGWRGGSSWRAWLTAIAIVGLVGSFGKFGGPLWWARWGQFSASLGPHDSGSEVQTGYQFLPDGAGSIYGLLVLILPGFDMFRYPSKLLPLAAVGIAALAGAGWDDLKDFASRVRLRRLGVLGLALSLLGLVATMVAKGRAVAFLAGHVPASILMGPADVAGAWAQTQRALAHGAIISSAVFVIARWAPKHPRSVATLAILLLTGDLAVANRESIFTIPQFGYDTPPEAARLIEAAERSQPSPGPFRIHRMTGSYPPRFLTAKSTDRFVELITWGRQTLHPLFALPLNLQYCATSGTLELDDHAALFNPQLMTMPGEIARVLGEQAGQPVLYFPRRSFDLWGARYLLLPAVSDWASPVRGYASFLDKTDLIYPEPEVLFETRGRDGQEPWRIGQDWQLRRNRAAFPRAWVVHHARLRPPASDPDSRARLMRTLVFMNDPIWREPGRSVLDLRQSAVIETNDLEPLQPFISPTPVGPSEQVVVTTHEPQRVELTVSLEQPGFVILADTYYPGWHLKIDGRPAPILRANRLMRAACVSAGEHRLLFTYEPESFRIGAVISTVALLTLFILGWRLIRNAPAPHAASG